jgi:transposase
MGGGSVMVWAAFSWHGKSRIAFINGRMNSIGYQEMLETFLIPYLERRDAIDFIFQQDNAPIHASNSTRQWFTDNNIPVLDWPARSPDMNPIENVWGMMVRAVYADCKQYETTAELKQAIKWAWINVQRAHLENLINGMPKRLMALLKAHGGVTKY